MKRCILIPDSFKGTMSSAQVCEIMARAIRTHHPSCEILSIPVADGGEGTVDCLLTAAEGERIPVRVKGPYFEEMDCCYGLLPDGAAIIEMAACAGLPLVGENRNAGQTTTYGVGQMIRHAVEAGCSRVVVGLGGSATNDGGTGMAAALGYRFRDRKGNPFVPVGDTLKDIGSIEPADGALGLDPIMFTAMTDVDNPLYGENGAAHVFGPQKGADAQAVASLDQGLRHLSHLLERDLGRSIGELPGSGAAGGLGGGMAAFCGARLQMGIDAILDLVQFDRLLPGTDLVITGEGKLDVQSLRGKVVIGVSKRTKQTGVPLIAVVGDIGDGAEQAYALGVSGIFSINRLAIPYAEAKHRAREDLFFTVSNLIHCMKQMGRP